MTTTVQDILNEIEPLGSESYRRTMSKHGVKPPFFGVKIGDMKGIVKRIKRDYQLALGLYATGNYDAMYLAGLIADDAKMTRADLQRWVQGAYCWGLSGATVPWVAAGSAHGWELALEWIESKSEQTAAAGWATLQSLVSIKPDKDLDLPGLQRLLQRVAKTIHQAPDRVRYQMNSFVIAVGCYVAPLTEAAREAAKKMGTVTVDMGETACEVPEALPYIAKVEERGTIGKKRKSAKC